MTEYHDEGFDDGFQYCIIEETKRVLILVVATISNLKSLFPILFFISFPLYMISIAKNTTFFVLATKFIFC